MYELMPFPRPDDGPVLVVPPSPPWARAASAAGWRVRHRDLAARPWCQAGTLVVAGADWPVEVIVLALARGAGVVIGPADHHRCGDRPEPVGSADRPPCSGLAGVVDLAVVLEDARRMGAVVWPSRCGGPTSPSGLDVAAALLLDALARGRAVGAAARETNMSLRTAHRRLRDVRRALGAATTAEAVGRWAQGRLVPAGDEL
jgi:hypothetical protein